MSKKAFNSYKSLLTDAWGKNNLPQAVSFNKRDYLHFFKIEDITRNTARFRYGNLENNLTSEYIERELYRVGTLVAFKYAEQVIILPYTWQSNLNIYRYPIKVRPFALNGGMVFKEYSTGFDMLGKYTESECEAVILFSPSYYLTGSSAYGANSYLIDIQAEIIARLKNNLKNIDQKPVFKVADLKTADAIKTALTQQYNSDLPFTIVAANDSVIGESELLHAKIDNITQDLIELLVSITNILNESSGINTSGIFNKKERKITAEVEEDESALFKDLEYRLRLDFVNRVNITFGTNISLIDTLEEQEEERNKEDGQQLESYDNNNDDSDSNNN